MALWNWILRPKLIAMHSTRGRGRSEEQIPTRENVVQCIWSMKAFVGYEL
jgi:hypothetical protein